MLCEGSMQEGTTSDASSRLPLMSYRPYCIHSLLIRITVACAV